LVKTFNQFVENLTFGEDNLQEMEEVLTQLHTTMCKVDVRIQEFENHEDRSFYDRLEKSLRQMRLGYVSLNQGWHDINTELSKGSPPLRP